MSAWYGLQALLTGIPDLDGARCKGEADLFEATVGGRSGRHVNADREHARASALRLCAECPALLACRQWLAGERPTRRPRGVVAGQIITSTGTPAKCTAHTVDDCEPDR